MKNRSIRIIIFLSIIAVVGLIYNQYIRVQNTIANQEKIIEIKKENEALQIQNENTFYENEQFVQKVTLALLHVRDELISYNAEFKDIYLDSVKQIANNYFVVSFYDTINPILLQNLIVKKLEEFQIKESFEYRIYDCFIDSIIFDKYVDLSSGAISTSKSHIAQQKWSQDGYYFGVYFPNKKED